MKASDLLVSAMVFAGTAAAAHAGGMVSQSESTVGGTVRLVVGTSEAEDGRLRAALDIQLEPGWKTYWRDPGGSGIPPSVTASQEGQAVAAEILFPAPVWIRDDYAEYPAYDQPVMLPLLLAAAQPGQPVGADIFLGICKTICIPVQARLEATSPYKAADSLVSIAFNGLPEAATETAGLATARINGQELLVEPRLPEGDVAEALFIAAPPGWAFSPVEKTDSGTFRSSVLLRPEAAGGTLDFDYTLVTRAHAIAGQIAAEIE